MSGPIQTPLTIMKNPLSLALATCLFVSFSFSQVKFSDEVKKYIDYETPVIVMKNALLIDGRGNAAKAGQTVIVINGKIKWVGDDARAVVPPSAQMIDLNGKTLMPGLVMLHEHMYISAHSISPRYPHVRQVPMTFPRLYLAGGATTIRTCRNVEPYSDFRIKKDIDLGRSPGPSIELTAPYIEGSGSMFPQMNELKGAEDTVSFVNYWADQGATSFKAYMGVDKPILEAAIDTAHKRHLKVTAHLCAVTYREAAELGIDSLEHGFYASTD
ncbi:MAG: amidohydrolase, partial [Pyrinomonadaceae bacterium]